MNRPRISPRSARRAHLSEIHTHIDGPSSSSPRRAPPAVEQAKAQHVVSRASAAASFPTNPTAPLLMLEHVNINVPSVNLARQFYFEILCAGEDPRPAEMLANRAIPEADGLLWANFGLQQFHLPVEQEVSSLACYAGSSARRQSLLTAHCTSASRACSAALPA